MGKLFGFFSVIFKGLELGLVEGFYIFKKGNYYYLIVVEGGIDKDYVVIIVRLEIVFGFYELLLNRLLLFSKCLFNLFIKCFGYGDICIMLEGESILVYLCSWLLIFCGCFVMGWEIVL